MISVKYPMKWRWNSSNNQFEIRTISKFENFLLCNYVYSINAQKRYKLNVRSSKFTIFLILCTHMMSLKLLILAVQSSMQDVCHLIWRLQWPNLPQSLWLSSRALNTKIRVLIPHRDPEFFFFYMLLTWQNIS